MADLYEKLIEHILRNQEQFYRIAYCYTYNKDGALDVVQNAILKALEKHKDLRNKQALKTWFYRILINESLQYIRKAGREIPFEPSELREEIYEENAFLPRHEVFKEVMKLPPENKTIILLHYYEGLTLKEVAAVTGVNENTVKTRLYSGLRKLKKTVKEDAV